MTQHTASPFLTTAEAAAARGVSYRQVLHAVRTGSLPAQRVGRISVIARADLEHWEPGRRPPPLVKAVPSSALPDSMPPCPPPHPPAAVDRVLVRLFAETRAQGAFLEQLIAAAPIGIAVVEGPEHRFLLANEVYRRYKHDPEIVGQTFRAAMPLLEGEAAAQYLDRARATGETVSSNDFLMPGPAGEERYYSFLAQPVNDADRLLLVVWETTDQMIARRRLAEQSALLEATLASIPDGIMITDVTGRLLYVNELVSTVMGTVPTDLSGRITCWQVRDSNGNLVPVDQAPVRRVLRGEVVRELLLGGQNTRGEEKWANTSAAPIRLPDGSVRGVVVVMRDVTEDEERKRALARERERLRAIIESSPVGILMVDATDHVIRQCTAFTDSMLGAQQLPPHTLEECVEVQHVWLPNGEPCPYEQLPLVRALHGETVMGMEIRMRQPDGRHLPILVNATPMRDDQGHIIGAVAVDQDISKFKELEAQRDAFMSMAAHELRSPLTAIKGYAQILHRHAQSHQSPELPAITTMLEQTQRLHTLIDELIDLSRLQLGRLELQRAPVDLTELAAKVVRQAEAMASGRTVWLHTPGPVTGYWDPFRLEQVLTNLLSNATKYSPPDGTITVSVGVHAGTCAGCGHKEVEVAVTDHGIGIPHGQEEAIFEQFHRAAATEKETSLGLGLYIARSIVEQHGGRLWAESPGPGQGSTFRLVLPRD